jgi:Ca2+-binding RTX toxin-like protein
MLIGNDAANHLTGRGGKDVMTGNGAADVFVFATLVDSSATLKKSDVITDFQEGVDQIDIHGLDANSKVAGLDHFSFAGAVVTFTGAGQVRYAQDVVHNQTLVYLNTDIDQAAESTIVLLGLHTLGAGDFILV